MRTNYEVEGNMLAEKSSEAYPVMALCEDCVGGYTVVNTFEQTSDSCEDCGADD
ncbi:hypothetical protein V4F52_004545 [Vibrio vulnificus]|uniref:hypothetical protein n=1 Tax=Vibrio hyugaensis TaxID=1534743 RepID=UPI0005EF3D6B|nr:hypothetical protein [Vibrio hyugaensis]